MSVQTLREVAGLGTTPARLQDSALIMVDLQNTYREGVMRLKGVEEALVQARLVLDRARALGRPVIHIRHDAGVGSPYDVTAPIGQIADPVAPIAGETVITKLYPNSFIQTPLDETLKRLGIKDLVRTGWDVKGFLKMVVTSATYRQDSRAPRSIYERDPENRLLARGPRVRLQAEFLRDLALSASGLLDDRIGGAPVFPYQPAGLWEELMSREDNDAFTAQKYVPSKGRDLYRRTMYTFIKRTSPHPSLSNFDAPDRQVCSVRRPRTNTPLQALALMNDPTYVEAARHLASRMVEAAKSDEERVASGFRRVVGRTPTKREIEVLLRLHREQVAVFRHDVAAARRLLSVGDSAPTSGDAAEMAAWAVVAGAILNLDEAVTKG